MPCSSPLNALLRKNIFRFVWALVTASILSACGSGDPSVPDDIDDIIANEASISLALSDGGADGRTITQGSDVTNTILVSLSNSSGGISGEVVSISTTLGTISGNGQSVTNTSGIASFGLVLIDAIEGDAGVLTASYTNESNTTITETFNILAGEATDDGTTTSASVAISLESGGDDDRTLAQGADNANTVFVTLTDSVGNITGQTIALTTTIGTLTGNGTTITDSGGVANFTLVLENQVEGDAGTLTASYVDTSGNTVTDIFNVQAGASEDGVSINASLSIALATGGEDGRTLTQGTGVTNTIIVTLSDSTGNPEGQTVTLSSSLGTVIGNGDQLTDSNGIASFNLTLSDAIEGDAGILTASFTDSSSSTITESFNVQAGEPDDGTSASATLNILLADGGDDDRTLTQGESFTNLVLITLNNTEGDNDGQTINVTSSLGEVVGNGQQLTNNSGLVTFAITLTGATEGDSGVITATFVNPEGDDVTETFNVRAGEAETVNVDSTTLSITLPNGGLNGRTITQGADVTNEIEVMLQDADGGIANELISVSSTLGTIVGNGQQLSDSNGEALFLLTLSGATEGDSGVITATYVDNDDNTTTATFNIEAGEVDSQSGGTSLAITVSSAADQRTLDQAVANTIEVTLLDGNAAPLENQIISLSTDLGTINGSGQSLTDINGIASFVIELTDANEGDAGIITATFSDEEQPSSTTYNVVAGPPSTGSAFTLELELYEPGSTTVTNVLDPELGNTINILLEDENGPRSNEVILLGTDIGSISPTQVLTNASGEATTQITSDQELELAAGTLTARFVDPISDTEFTETENVQVGASGSSGNIELTAIFIDTSTGGQLLDIDGNVSNTLDTGSNTPIRITLLDTDGDPFDSPQIVSIISSQGSVIPSSGTVLTNTNNGIASAQINVSGLDEGTAGSITVSFTDAETGTVFTENLNFEAGETAAADEVERVLVGTMYDQAGYILDPSELDAITGLPTTSASQLTQINLIQPAIVEFWYTEDGVPQSNTVINVTSDLGLLSPTSGNILTDDNGLATLVLSVGSAESGEAGTITAFAGDIPIEEPLTFSIGSSNLALGTGAELTFTQGELEIGDNTLAAGGSTIISVNIVNSAQNSELYTTPIEIDFSSQCADLNLASIDTPITSAGGTATTTYTANGCEDDVIVATITSVDGPSADGIITIDGSSPTSISFVSATPETIALQGTGGSGRSESAEVVFQVIDNTGSPEANVTVDFTLSTATGGVNLVEVSALSNAAGNVTARVNSGNIPTPVRVQATISGSTIATVSDVLVVSTGLPDQNSFTLSAEIQNIGGGDTNGVENEISIQAADAFNNPVPDGTAINFRTEFGSIQPSCTTLEGTCSVTWTSQNPRSHLTYTADDITIVDCTTTTNGVTRGIPCREDAAFGTPNGAYSTILAYALGEETFVDSNGDGLFDTGETYDDIPEAFLDHNDDEQFGNLNTVGSCSPACTEPEGGDEETFIDFDIDGEYDNADGIYNGTLCSTAAEAAGSCTTTLVNVFDTTTLVMSSTEAYFALYNENDGTLRTTDADTTAGALDLELDISDRFNGPLPAGTTVSISTTNCEIGTATDFEFGASDDEFLTIGITLSEDEDIGSSFGVVTVQVSVPSSNNLGGAQSVFSFNCIDRD